MLEEKKSLRVMVFLIIAALLFLYLNRVFSIGNSDHNTQIFNAFYQQEEDTIDVVCIGTSATNRFFIAPEAYHEEGIAAFNLATMGLPMIFVSNLIEEVKKTQDPQLYIIELRNALKSKNEVTDAHIRRVTDNLAVSENKYGAIEKALAYTEGAEGPWSDVDEDKWDYYTLPVVKYHGKLAAGDIRPKDFVPWNMKNKAKGYVLSVSTRTQIPQEKPVYSEKREALAPEMERALNDVLDYCDALGADVFFVLSPYAMPDGDAQKLNMAADMVRARGYEVLDCNRKAVTDAMGLRWEEDFYDSHHVNYLGAQKYTAYLTDYIAAHYDLPDRRGDVRYESWQKAYEKYLDYISKGMREVIEEEDASELS